MARPLDNVVALQEALAKLQLLDESLAGVPPEMRELHEEHTARKGEIEALEASVAQAETARRQAETGAEDCEVKLKHFQEQVSRVKTQKEYSAILHEIDTVKQQSREFEEQALTAMGTQEELESQLAELRAAFEDLDAQYARAAEKWEEERPGVAQQAETLRAHVAELREALPPPSLMLFDRIRERTNNAPLAEIISLEGAGRTPNMWHCGACHYNVRPQSVVDVRNNGSVLLCDSCKRILYIAETPD